jgi:hypothetical protein
MGHAASISDVAKTNTDFQKYINDRNAELDTATADAKTKMDAQIKKFYQDGNWGDAKPIASGAYQHLSTASTWSLDHVIEMIGAVRDAIFGGDVSKTVVAPTDKVPLPASAKGSDITPVTKNLLGMMAGTEAIIANAAFQAVTGILGAFKTSTQTDLVKNVIQKDIIPGMSLFVCVMENKYSSQSFFSGELIVQNFYIYDVRMSADRAADLAKFDRLNNLVSQQLDLETQVTEFSTNIHNLKLDDYKTKNAGNLVLAIKDYKSDFAALQSMIVELNKSIDDVGAMIGKMKAAVVLKNAAMVNAKHREILFM